MSLRTSFTFAKVNMTVKQGILMYQISHSVIKSILKVLSETELKFCSKLTSFCSQTWLLLLVPDRENL